MPRYWLTAHVHACATATGVILLDLKQDRYWGVGAHESRAIAPHVHGWPTVEFPLSTGHSDGTPEDVCANLLAQGLLCSVPPKTPARRNVLPDMSVEFISVGDEIEVTAPIRWRDLVLFCRAYVWASISLRLVPFLSVVEWLRESKRCQTMNHVVRSLDVEHVAALVDRFRRLRACAMVVEGHCLLHAVTLFKFLSYYGYNVDLIIGVAAQPFGAHAWVQWQCLLIDTNPEKVCRYTPLLVV